jgi:hypothetical protein
VVQSPNQFRAENSAKRTKEDAAFDALKAPVKRFYIIDREKILGPLSAHEVQSLYNRGVLNKKVKVQKIGGKRSMSIAQFVSNYAGDRMKELTEDGKIPQQIGIGSPSSKVLTELARMAGSRRVTQERQQKMLVVLAFIGLSIGLLAFLVIRHNAQKVVSTVPSEESAPLKPTNDPTIKAGRPRLIQKAPEARSQMPPSARPSLPNKIAAPTRTEPAPIKDSPEVSPRSAKVIKPQEPKPSRPSKRVDTKVSRPEKSKEQARQTARRKAADSLPATPSKPAPAEPVRSSIASTAPPASGPIAKALANVGRIQTIGPLSFSLANLEQCLSKCNLIMRDASGGTLKVVFFKNAYYESLQSRSKAVTLTGSTKLENGEITLIVQDVR